MANAINSLKFGDNVYPFTLPYGSCSTAAATAAKTVTVDNFSLETGAIVAVKFTATNTASSPTLNVNSTGAKAIYYKGAAITAGYLKANYTFLFIYNGTQFDFLGEIDTNTTYSAATTSANGLMSKADKTKLNYTNIAYATCETAGATTTKEITVSGNTGIAITTGTILIVKFSYTNTASNPVFSVNGITASVNYNTMVITSSNLDYAGDAGLMMMYVYDGTYFRYVCRSYDKDSNTTYTNASLGQGYAVCATATAAKVATLSSYALTTGGIVAVKFTYAVPASATLNINSKGAKAIYYRGTAITAGIIKAGDIATFIYDGSDYHLISIDRDTEIRCPDYANRIAKLSSSAATNSYTVTEDGYIQYASEAGSLTSDITIRINGINVWQTMEKYSPLFPVKNGDIVTYASSTGAANVFYFYPLR